VEIVPLTLSHMLCHTDLVKLLFAMYWVNHPSADPGECKSKWLKKHAAISIGHFTVTRTAAWEILISKILNKLEKMQLLFQFALLGTPLESEG